MTYQPIIIIGAARSGTNMLRDLLAHVPGVTTWPCDEINYLWRYGNANHPNDELRPEHASARVQDVIQKKFSRLAKKTGANWIVEKTCANSLRVDFVRSIFPDAKLIFLVRDGIDVVASAMLRWQAPLDLSYLLRKAVHIPWQDAPTYASRYAFHRLKRMLHPQRQLPTWGPRFVGMRELQATQPLDYVCGTQWKQCVTSASASLKKTPENQVCFLCYESFVRSPQERFSKLLDQLNIPYRATDIERIVSRVSAKSVGNGKASLSSESLRRLTPLVEETLAEVSTIWQSTPQPAVQRHAA